MRLCLRIAYDGKDFAGWQKQPNQVTVQGSIEQAMQVVCKQQIAITGAGRTDAGVHALAQQAHFDVPRQIQMNPYNWVPALNTKLPPTIRITDCREVASNFHACHQARQKTYHYLIERAPILLPQWAARCWHQPRQFNLPLLIASLQQFVGEHRFYHFCSARGNENEQTDYHRHILNISYREIIAEQSNQVQLSITGSGFLYKMVRMMVATAMAIAQGKLSEDYIRTHLATIEQTKTKHCAPADGLTLQQVVY